MDQASNDKFLHARIVNRTEIAPGLWSVRVDTGGAFHFVAGQYATLGVPTPQRLVERAYSIVSSPYEPELEFFFELVPEGDLTPLLHRLNPGDSMRSLGPRATTAYLCGHPEMIEHGKAILHRHGWEKDALKEEVYFVREAVHA